MEWTGCEGVVGLAIIYLDSFDRPSLLARRYPNPRNQHNVQCQYSVLPKDLVSTTTSTATHGFRLLSEKHFFSVLVGSSLITRAIALTQPKTSHARSNR